jgi:hypothetical protein
MSAPCGTSGGYQAHRKRGESACMACKDALAEYQAGWRHRSGRPSVRVLRRQRDEARAEVAAFYDVLRQYVVGAE